MGKTFESQSLRKMTSVQQFMVSSDLRSPIQDFLAFIIKDVVQLTKLNLAAKSIPKYLYELATFKLFVP